MPTEAEEREQESQAPVYHALSVAAVVPRADVMQRIRDRRRAARKAAVLEELCDITRDAFANLNTRQMCHTTDDGRYYCVAAKAESSELQLLLYIYRTNPLYVHDVCDVMETAFGPHMTDLGYHPVSVGKPRTPPCWRRVLCGQRPLVLEWSWTF